MQCKMMRSFVCKGLSYGLREPLVGDLLGELGSL